ncbi:MAG: DUF1015 domain-containing protein, partial [Chitinophagaceae bacterium]|nr:DUF1015 domain-containing protein [Chitinophagaceae bacterium]
YSDAVYQKAKENLKHLIDRHILFLDEKPCYYIYELAWKGRAQTGLVCISSVHDYSNNVIKKHELTRPEKEKDRIDHMLATRAQTGNVFLACKEVKELNDLMKHWMDHNNAEYYFTADDGVVHTVWVVNSIATIDAITGIFKEKVSCTYIADGHHRAASAAKVSQQLSDSDDAQYFLTTIFLASQLKILDYNRIVKDLGGLKDEEFLNRLEQKFFVEKKDIPVSPPQVHHFGMYFNNQWYLLTAKDGTYKNDPIGVLDVTILQENILSEILNIQDPRTDKRVDFVGGIRGLAELEKKVNSGEWKVGFSLHPVSIQQLFDIADSGNVMPPKSTWFEPKLRDGLFTHCI